MLYRCCLESCEHAWFLSLVIGGDPGTDQDIDFYSVSSRYRQRQEDIPYEDEPPLGGWGVLRGAEPPPKVKMKKNKK
jgi:hypothetical protein